MDYKYIEQLLEQYWHCETSLKEETILKTFFSQENIPVHLLPYQDLFAYEVKSREIKLSDEFESKIMGMIETSQVKAKHIAWRQRLMPLYKSVAVIAILLTIGNVAQNSFRKSERSYTDYNYENYKETYNDPEVAYDHVSGALQMVSESLNQYQQVDSLKSTTVDKE